MDKEFPIRRAGAFTLIELLVVIAIIVVLAAIIVPLVGVTGDKKAISTTRAEIERLSTLISVYKLKTGFYPPDPQTANDWTNSSLFYELISTTFNTNNNLFANDRFNVSISSNDLFVACGVSMVFNSLVTNSYNDIEDRKVRAYSFLKEVSPRQTNTITVNGQDIIVLVAPAEGPGGRKINPFYYRIGSQANGTRNPSSFDLWAEIKTRTGTKIIGNWKD